MRDKYEREIDYLRISLTDRCNLRCIYCMEEEAEFFESDEILRDDEIIKIVEVFASLGIKKLRLTGGEPLVRPKILELIKRLYNIEGIEAIYLTTNGITLKPLVKELKSCGVKGVNISLDTLDFEKYKKLTRYGELNKVLDSINECLKYNIKVKINSVLIKGINENEIFHLIKLTKNEDVYLRFIELMPIGIGEKFKGIESSLIKDIISSRFEYKDIEKSEFSNGPATYIKLKNHKGRIGFISAISECFCNDCNRIRLTSEGFLKSCLHFNYGVDLKEILRSNEKVDLEEIIKRYIFNKPKRHSFYKEDKNKELKFMNKIGG